MFLAIPLLIEGRLAQTKIRRQVNNLRREFGILFDVMLCLSMRLREKKNIHRFEHGWITELQLRPFPQVGMDLINVFAQMRARRDLLHFHLWMT